MKTHEKSKGQHIASKVFWAIFFLAGAAAAIGTGFGFFSLGISVGILVSVVALGAVAMGFLFGKFWLGFFMIAATIATILGANDIWFSLSGEQIGTLYITAAFLGIAFHILFSRNSFIGVGVLGGKHNADRETKSESFVDANFGGSTKYFDTEDFKTATIDCNFGGVKAYFDDAKIKGDKAEINVSCSFGGVELYIPKHWKIDNKTSVHLGAVEEENRPRVDEKSPIVTLKGDVNFGAIEITYI